MSLIEEAVVELQKRSIRPLQPASLHDLLKVITAPWDVQIVRPQCVIMGSVLIGKNVEIGPFNFLRGPLYLGDGVKIGAFNEIARSVILSDTHITLHSVVVDSLIGSGCRFSAGLVICNSRADLTGDKEECHIGKNTKVGVGVTFMPGVRLPENQVIVGPAIVDSQGRVRSLVK